MIFYRPVRVTSSEGDISRGIYIQPPYSAILPQFPVSVSLNVSHFIPCEPSVTSGERK
jgi:hypothetical protein